MARRGAPSGWIAGRLRRAGACSRCRRLENNTNRSTRGCRRRCGCPHAARWWGERRENNACGLDGCCREGEETFVVGGAAAWGGTTATTTTAVVAFIVPVVVGTTAVGEIIAATTTTTVVVVAPLTVTAVVTARSCFSPTPHTRGGTRDTIRSSRATVIACGRSAALGTRPHCARAVGRVTVGRSSSRRGWRVCGRLLRALRRAAPCVS